MEVIIIMSIILVLIVLLVVVPHFIILSYEDTKNKHIYLQEFSYTDALNLLDSIINEEFSKYNILHLQYTEDSFVNSQEHINIVNTITASVYNIYTNSEMLRYQLGLALFDTNDKEYIVSFIMDRVSIFSVEFVKKINSTQE